MWPLMLVGGWPCEPGLSLGGRRCTQRWRSKAQRGGAAREPALYTLTPSYIFQPHVGAVCPLLPGGQQGQGARSHHPALPAPPWD